MNLTPARLPYRPKPRRRDKTRSPKMEEIEKGKVVLDTAVKVH